ncbi:MAG TPA: CRISPR-associated endonuclease Cas2 [Gemmataceae bacterium]|nr:CRISPR-associated endonuclease Cas2 [Gemmataceae bacterium]
MQGTHWWLICYDVHDPKRLRRTAKHVEGYGERMQYSIFRCWLTPQQVQCLRWELTEILAPEDDLLLIPLCLRCVEAIQGAHSALKAPDWPDEPPGHLIV